MKWFILVLILSLAGCEDSTVPYYDYYDVYENATNQYEEIDYGGY